MTVADILRNKGGRVLKIRQEASLLEAIRALVQNGVGSLVVTDERDRVVGLITERDILRENARHFDNLSQRRVVDLMSPDVIIGFVEDSVEYVMALMTEKRIRHLPIMTHGRLVGLVSIGDVVKARVREAEVEIRHLTDYIMGKYPG
jgi:CBS domain-containing protein